MNNLDARGADGMDLSITTTTYAPGDNSWLGSTHGLDSTKTITLSTDPDDGFDPEVHLVNGAIPSGTALAKNGDGLYGPYDPAGSDGLDAFVGHLYGDVAWNGADTPAGLGAAILLHGYVREARLPVFSGSIGEVDSDAKTAAAGRIIYI